MRIHCTTNLDLCYYEKWPTDLPAVPRVGEQIESMHAWDKVHLRLQVCAVRWQYYKDIWNDDGSTFTGWAPCIELHLPSHFHSITEFYEWYGRVCGRGVHAFI